MGLVQTTLTSPNWNSSRTWATEGNRHQVDRLVRGGIFTSPHHQFTFRCSVAPLGRFGQYIRSGSQRALRSGFRSFQDGHVQQNGEILHSRVQLEQDAAVIP